MHEQHLCDGLHQQVWRNSIFSTEQSCNGYLELLISSLNQTIDPIRTLSMQSSRLTILTTTATGRMELTPLKLRLARTTLGSSPDKSLCFTQQPSTSSLCHLELSIPGGSPNTATTDATPTAGHSRHAQMVLSTMIPASSTPIPAAATHSHAMSLDKRQSRSPINSEHQMYDACLKPRIKHAHNLNINAAACTLRGSSHLSSKRQYTF
ncbi:hypothetical protein RMATCC62417_16550 [Rhizopus microsporus]|nr:hypothetical protein RMATCC62417_16550 [Rhizopus microsporus]